MHCPEASEALSLLLDSALRPEEERTLVEHLRSCAECDRELQLMERLSGLLRDAEMLQPASLFTSRVMARVEQHKRQTMWLRGAVILLLGVATGLCLCLVPLLGPGSPIADVVARPSLVSSLAGLSVRLTGVLATLFDAAALLTETVLGAPGYVGLVSIVGLATLLTIAWLTAVTRASGRVYRS